MGVDCGDLNGDGIPDLMVSNITDSYALEESNLVYLSTGDTRAMSAGIAPYREAGESLGLARSGWAWDVRFGDFDNAGVPEVLQATGFAKGTIDRWPELQELAMGNDLMLHNPAHWPHFAAGDDLRLSQECVQLCEGCLIRFMRVVRIDSGAGIQSWQFPRSGLLARSVELAADLQSLMHLRRSLANADGKHRAYAG